MLLLVATTAFATDRLVPSVHGTLQEAVDASVPGDRVVIDATAMPVLTESVEVAQSLSIVGAPLNKPVLHPSDPNDGVIRVSGSGVVVDLVDLVLDGTGTGRLLYVHTGTANLQNVDVLGGYSPTSGGAIFVETGAGNTLEIHDSTLSTSSTDVDGGLICMAGGDLTITGSTLFDSSAVRGGLVYLSPTASVALETSTLMGGTADSGGALFSSAFSGSIDIVDTRFEDNTAGDDGGAIAFDGPASATIDRATFAGNVANDDGGAVHITDNAEVDTIDSTFCQNQAAADGGGVYLEGAEWQSTRDVFLDNSAGGNGGAVGVSSGGSGDVERGSFALNSASVGQALYSSNSLRIDSSYLADHTFFALETIVAESTMDAVVAGSAFDRNSGANYNANVQTLGTNLEPANAGVATPSTGACDRLALTPPLGTTLEGAGVGNDNIGALDPAADNDGDGYFFPVDCNDADSAVNPNAIEVIADGVDSDCDGAELCYYDLDEDGFGTLEILESVQDEDCDDRFESDNADESCPGHDDGDDDDGDGVPDGCDLCDGDDNADDDSDDVPDACDICPGFDDALDSDKDGIPNGCDTCKGDTDDTDGDGVPDACDLCPGGDDTIDKNNNGVPDACDPPVTEPTTPTDNPGPNRELDAPPATDGCGCGGPGGGRGLPLMLVAGVGLIARRAMSTP